MRTFYLERVEDVTGVSGTGVVAEGVVFSSGLVAIGWLGKNRSVVIYESVECAMAVHGHGGKTKHLFRGVS